MTPRRISVVSIWVVSWITTTVGCLFVLAGPARAGRSPALAPDSLYAHALNHLERGTPEYRHLALDELDQAMRGAHDRTDILHCVARTYASMGYLARARECLDLIAETTADDAEAQIQLGILWKEEWLASLEVSSFQKALRCLLRGAQLAPKRLEPRVAITALALAKGDTALAVLAAQGAYYSDPRAVETALALGCAAYRTGRLTMADSLFRAVLPRLPDALAPRFKDPSGGALIKASRPDARDNTRVDFWTDSDPDLTTPENEVQLDFWARIAHAALLFKGPQGITWDMRTELFTRYGVPPKVELPPPPGIDEDLFTWSAFVFGTRESPPYPYHKQTWVYPELGIRAELWDRSLRQSYALSVSRNAATDPRPNPALLANRPDLVMLDEGRSVFRAMAPGVIPIPVRGAIARFPTERGTRLVVHLEVPAEAADSLRGSWAVVGADGHLFARGSAALVLSACAPGEHQFAQFEAEVPPGAYRVHLAVGGSKRRGIARLATRVEAEPPGLAMSDLVMLCGAPVAAVGSGPLLIEPTFEEPLRNARMASVYFEIHHLAVDDDRQSRFSYRYILRAVDDDAPRDRPRKILLEASREEENIGPFRRQVVSAPIAKLDPGRYDFEVEVRDLVSGTVAARSVRFRKD